MSITNIITALKITNGIEAGQCNFVRPTEDDDFEKPWSFSPGAISISMDFVLDETQVVPLTKKQLNEILDKELSGK